MGVGDMGPAAVQLSHRIHRMTYVALNISTIKPALMIILNPIGHQDW